jgi:hypothetical protein
VQCPNLFCRSNIRLLLAHRGAVSLELFSNPRVTARVAYVVERGQVGTVGFECPLTINVWPEPSTRSTWVQGSVVPAFAVDRPFALKKLTSISG